MDRRLVFSRHARERMLGWHLDVADIRAALRDAQTVEEYPDGACLLLGRAGLRPLHLVVADDPAADITVVITVYEPSLSQWDATFRRRLRP
ncbi:MAG TPA: DUF4258 domain-containing protein [Frankiaceae bacterium]|nr:DUF4258 domain-containing protein [Frankiaceae bacterium]